MTKKAALTLAALLFLFVNIHAQAPLPESTRGSAENLVYMLSRESLRKIHYNNKEMNDELLGALVSSYKIKEEPPANLKRGNYVVVSSVNENLLFYDLTVDDLYFSIIPAEEFALCLYDASGNIIEDAQVYWKKKQIAFDKKTRTYRRNSIPDGAVLEVDHQGVYHYIEINTRNKYYYAQKSSFFKGTWKGISRFFSNTTQWVKDVFQPSRKWSYDRVNGFVVFSKPKYKPNETVRFKGYVAQNNGKPYKGAVEVRLTGGIRSERIDTMLTMLDPYRPGMYMYDFKLADSLKMKLDANYQVSLRIPTNRQSKIGASFKYEEYELKSTRFTAGTEKSVYHNGEEVKLLLKARDENDMALYGGRVRITMTASRINNIDSCAFVPNTLWEHTEDMSEKADQTVIVPDSVFPRNVSLTVSVNYEYLSADNERVNTQNSFQREASDHRIDINMNKGLLSIDQLKRGEKQHHINATLLFSGEGDKEVEKREVMLPCEITVPWTAHKVKVTTSQATASYNLQNLSTTAFTDATFNRNNDSIFLQMKNPSSAPYWYIIREGKKDLVSTYGEGDISLAQKAKVNEGYSMELQFLFAGKARKISSSIPTISSNMTLEVETPLTVYPGKTTNVDLFAHDNKGKPIENVDITAYAYTSKFGAVQQPTINFRGKRNEAKAFDNLQLTTRKEGFYSSSPMNWGKWRDILALDSISFYHFIFPETSYTYTETTADSTTLLAPFVTIDGTLPTVELLWIDNRLYYANVAEQEKVYLFHVKPGTHNIMFRTYDRLIEVKNFNVEEGKKTIVSFNAKAATEQGKGKMSIQTQKLKKDDIGKLNRSEIQMLREELISVDRTQGYIEYQRNGSGQRAEINRPLYIHSGNTYYYLNAWYPYANYYNNPIIAGPFPTRRTVERSSNLAMLHVDSTFSSPIQLTGGHKYEVYPDLQRVTKWDNTPFRYSINQGVQPTNFKQELMSPEAIERKFNESRLALLQSRSGALASLTDNEGENMPNRNTAVLYLRESNNKVRDEQKPALIYFTLENDTVDTADLLFFGGTLYFSNLPSGNMQIHLVYNDSTAVSRHINLKNDGRNYLSIDIIDQKSSAEVARKAFDILEKSTKHHTPESPINISQEVLNNGELQYSPYGGSSMVYATENSISGKVVDMTGAPIAGVTVWIKNTKYGTITDINGRFILHTPHKKPGKKVQFEVKYIGYLAKKVKAKTGDDLFIRLQEDNKMLDEVVTIAYGAVSSTTRTGAVADEAMKVRGTSTADAGAQPLIIVNGLPYDGSMESLSVDNIESISVLKEESATAIYGAQAAAGVVIIELRDADKANENSNDWFAESGNSMRRNFHDDAFWQPKLTTDKQGKASFEVTYPDDITSWNANFIAIGNKKQASSKTLSIRSFKALSARLALPQFTVRGDSLNAVGRIANHFGDSITVTRSIQANGKTQEKALAVGTSHVDYIPLYANQGDSIKMAYMIKMSNGYFDGEERSTPIIEQGMLQTHGDFKVLNDTETYTFDLNPALGEATVYAEASSISTFLKEIDRIDVYPYLCNEQMASKIKALLAKKRILKALNKPFNDNDERKIVDLIERLTRNKNINQLWGWWGTEQTRFWISTQVVEALMEAEKDGYKTGFNKEAVARALSQEFDHRLNNAPPANAYHQYDPAAAKDALLDMLTLLMSLDANIDYQNYVNIIQQKWPETSVGLTLKAMHIVAEKGEVENISFDELMSLSHTSILGSLYWEQEKGKTNIQITRFLEPQNTDIIYTLTAYCILKKMGGQEEHLAKIRNYLFECRKTGYWRNTFEASRIIETVLPDMLKQGEQYADATIWVNEKPIQSLPYTGQLSTDTPIRIRKSGTLPVFTTAYQQNWNESPVSEAEKGFKISSYFVSANRDTVANLEAGKPVFLEVEITLEGNANYVQIEVPIPAGCSFENKVTYFTGKEAHREYFKEKVSIFCPTLDKGKHTFRIELNPRFTGMYHLNPAKVELMYFPVFYGNEEMKNVRIDSEVQQ